MSTQVMLVLYLNGEFKIRKLLHSKKWIIQITFKVARKKKLIEFQVVFVLNVGDSVSSHHS
jgi:hypothetical protein